MSTGPRRMFSDSGQAGFTRIELVVLVAMIALLMVFPLSAVNRLRSQSKIARCAGNLRQLGVSMLLYGNDYAERLPVEAPHGTWLWDLDWNIGTMLNEYGASDDVMYCPGTSPRFQPSDNDALYEYYAPGTIHVLGYCTTLPSAPSSIATNSNPTIRPQPIRAASITLPPPLASQRVLNADATIKSYAAASLNSYVWIQGGYAKAHLSPHLNGFIPAGGNVGMLDGHVEWRPFSQMQGRSLPGGTPFFFW